MVYTVREMAKLRRIGCMKKAGMSVKDIRQYIEMALQGNDTIDLCLSLFEHQRGVMKRQMEELQHAMEMVDYKCWYYETAKAAARSMRRRRRSFRMCRSAFGKFGESFGSYRAETQSERQGRRKPL